MFSNYLVAGFKEEGIYLTIIYGFWAATTGAYATITGVEAKATTNGAEF